jgi:threonine dehydratase
MLVLKQEERERGVITASAGNHALGVVFAPDLCRVNTHVVLPLNAADAKVRKLRQEGCEIIQGGDDYDDAEALAHQIGEERNLTFIHAFDDPYVIAGQGTVGVEIAEQVADVDILLVPVGGGGLVSGIAWAMSQLHPHARVIGVQSAASPAMHKALSAGCVVETPIQDTVADGLAGRYVSPLTYELTRNLVDDVVLVEEIDICRAVRFLFDDAHLLVEASAAVGVAALLARKVNVEGKTVVSVLTGRNIDSHMIREIFAAVEDKNIT